MQRSTTFLAFLFAVVSAQTPPIASPLLLKPGSFGSKCLTATSNNDGATVTVQDCNGGDGQKWSFSGGSVKIYGNKCLDVTDGNTADGNKLQIWTCFDGNTNQQFWYTGDNRLAWTNHGKCVDLTDGSSSNGNRIQTWACTDFNSNQVWNAGGISGGGDQSGGGGGGGGSGGDQSSTSRNAWINDVDDFCLYAPPTPATIGDSEAVVVSYCTKAGRGTRTIPNGALHGVHFVKTPDYVQVTGVGDFTTINIVAGDEGGELDPHGADGNGNPVGGVVYGSSGQQYQEWTMFISDSEFCFRACSGSNAATLCNHIYDLQGCYWNIPANYDPGVFESCQGDDDLPMGVYGASTWYQGISPTPPAHPAAPSSNCRTLPTVGVTPAKRSAKMRL